MDGKQRAVMWLGLLLITVRLFTTSQWHDIWSTILKGESKSSGPSIIPPLGGLLPEIPLLATAPTQPQNSGNNPGSMSV